MLKLEHIGIAVEEGSTAASTFERLFGAIPYKKESVGREGVETSFVDAGGPKLELLESTDDNSAIAKYLKKRGEGIHHIAVEVDDIIAQLERVRQEGFSVLSEHPLAGADGKQIFFVHPRDCHGILVEFCQQTRPTWRNTEIETPSGTITAYSAGSTVAQPVLLLHDQDSSTGEDFNDLLPTLERSMHVISFDAPGHATHKLGWAVLNSHSIDRPVVVVGRGMAAETAINLAQSNPDFVLALVLIDPQESIIGTLRETCPDKPILVCSLKGDSLDVATEISSQYPSMHLSVIPDTGRRQIQLAEQIVACGEWN